MRLIDTHCHLAHGRLFADLAGVRQRAADAGLVACICASAHAEEAHQAQKIAADCPEVFFTAGIHPHDAKKVTPDYLAVLEELAADPKHVAVGEIGLDYHYNFSPPEAQQKVFAEQLALAKRLGKRVVVHTREAFEDTMAIIAESGVGGENLLFHSFTGEPDQGRRIMDLGAMVSFSGIATFKKTDLLRQTAAAVPDDRILVETDAPYLSPEPVRSMKTNEPANVAHVANCLAAVRGVSPEAFAEQTTANAIRFFQCAV